MRNSKAWSVSTALFYAFCATDRVQAQESPNVEIRTGVLAASNPFLTGGDDAGSIALTMDVLPEFRWEDETSTIVLDGQITVEEWLNRYDTDLSGQAALKVDKAVSETLALFGEAAFETSKRATRGLLTGQIGEGAIPTNGANLDLAPILVDQTVRRQSALASLGAEKKLSSTQTLRGEILSTANWFDQQGADYRTSSLELEYIQKLNPRFELVFGANGALSDFLEQSRGDGAFGAAHLGMKVQLSSTGSLSANAGVVLVRTNTGTGGTENGEFLIANVEFCEELFQGKMCASGFRESRPTTIGGASTVTAGSFTWSKEFGRNEILNLDLRYSDTKPTLAAFDLANVGRTKFLGVTAYYTRPISESVGLYINPSAVKLFDDPFDRGSNYQMMVGLTFNFGR